MIRPLIRAILPTSPLVALRAAHEAAKVRREGDNTNENIAAERAAFRALESAKGCRDGR